MTQRTVDQGSPSEVGKAELRSAVYEAPASEKFPRARFMFIDILRLIAAAAVMVQHVAERSAVPAIRAVCYLSPGVFGVVLFFLVSGFVMPLSVRHKLVPQKFAVRRIFRIYPGLLAAIVLYACTQILVEGDAAPFWKMQYSDWIANLLLVQDFVGARPFLGVTWTLILEMIWYALFAYMWLSRGGRSGSILAIAAPAFIILLMLGSLFSGHRFPMGRIGMIYAAIIGMRAYQKLDGQISSMRLSMDACLFSIIMILSNILAFGYFKHPNLTMNESLWPWLLATVVFMSTQWPVLRDSPVMTNRFLARIGAVSLSIYLLHPCAILICQSMPSEWLRIPAIVIITGASAAIFYVAVERPGIAVGRRLEQYLK